MQTGEIAGWYGKLPSLGDFASRRLAPAFIEAWDDWLASGLADWREREPATWLDQYLAGPSWRFVLMPDVLPGERRVWAGVLMPSVDKVGRYFPLTLAQPLPDLPCAVTQDRALLDWLQRLDDLAVDSLHDDWSVEQLESALQRLGPWQQEPVPPHEMTTRPVPGQLDPSTLEFRTDADVLTLLGGVAREHLLSELQGRAMWLRSDDQGRPVLRITAGLPRAVEFSALLTSVDAIATSAPPL